MLKDITEVHPLGNFHLYLRFEDGVEGVVDIAELIRFTGVFAPRKDPGYFTRVCVYPDLGIVCWPNEADIDPDVLDARITGEPLRLLSQQKLSKTIKVVFTSLTIFMSAPLIYS